tara:strand:+ start:92 stop:337 length:246 start_codon:yes stop_codon:yes gene_type:complete
MADMTHEDIERIWNSFSHYIPERSKLDGAVDFISTLRDIGVEDNELKASSDYDPKLEEAVTSVYADEEDDEDYGDDGELVY